MTFFTYAGAAIVILWGAAHIAIPTRSIIEGFGPISADNRRILLMEWLMEGVLLLFIRMVVILVACFDPIFSTLGVIVYRACSLVLVTMAAISVGTGAQTTILPMRLCPAIFLTAAALIFLPTVL
jgi:hypothetical protein